MPVCGICGSSRMEKEFSKSGRDQRIYDIFLCKTCSTRQVYPLPSQDYLDGFYQGDYFTQRTDRGYDNYYTEEMKNELRRVWRLNLEDLGVYDLLTSRRARALDIGCAAGYFLDYLRGFGWDTKGIEIAEGPIRFARETLDLDVVKGDFLEWDKEHKEKFHLISLWASIEHMRDPVSILKKIHNHLEEDGILVLSTCRYGLQARWKKSRWRFLNVPEHLFYFDLKPFQRLMVDWGYSSYGVTTYGSGYTRPQKPSLSFRIRKKVFDKLVKISNQGDMMAIAFGKKSDEK